MIYDKETLAKYYGHFQIIYFDQINRFFNAIIVTIDTNNGPHRYDHNNGTLFTLIWSTDINYCTYKYVKDKSNLKI